MVPITQFVSHTHTPKIYLKKKHFQFNGVAKFFTKGHIRLQLQLQSLVHFRTPRHASSILIYIFLNAFLVFLVESLALCTAYTFAMFLFLSDSISVLLFYAAQNFIYIYEALVLCLCEWRFFSFICVCLLCILVS